MKRNIHQLVHNAHEAIRASNPTLADVCSALFARNGLTISRNEVARLLNEQLEAGAPMGNRNAAKIHQEQFRKGESSKYLDIEKNGEWYHVRIADHENTTEQVGIRQMQDSFQQSIAKQTESGLTHPHNIQITTDKLPETKTESRELANKVTDAIPKLDRTKFDDGTVYGQTVKVKIQNGDANFSNEDSGEKGKLNLK
jgi:hypothetical protein